MNKIEPDLLDNHLTRYNENNLIFIATAGFEARARGIAHKFKDAGLSLAHSYIIDYLDFKLNEPNRTKLISILKKISIKNDIISEDLFKNKLDELANKVSNSLILVDITGMSRVLFFKIINMLEGAKIKFDIGYTEANSYYPKKNFYATLKTKSQGNEDDFYKLYREYTQDNIIYSFDCNVFKLEEFKGRPEPGRSAALIGFLTFKRSRLQAVLRTFDFSKRILIIGDPVREDLQWRREMMELVNRDLLSSRWYLVEKVVLKTLYPQETYDYLEKLYQENESYKYNFYLAPLGSKMQALGAYLFWRNHPEITLVFSQPLTYYRKYYSTSWRNSFIIDGESFNL